jgi:hypothetical protein
MKCILCYKHFRDRTLEEILQDDAIEYLCNSCYETDFDTVNGIPEDLKQEINMVVRMNNGKKYFLTDFEE